MKKFIKNNIPFISIFLICIALFSFHFWMAYPGFIMTDSQEFLLLYKNNWQPVGISYMIQGLFFLFSRHVYLLLLLNLFPFYLGIFIFLFSFYKKFNLKGIWAVAIVSFLLICNHFFSNFNLLSTSVFSSFLLCLWALTFYIILNPIHNKMHKILFFIFYGGIFLLTIMSRHNAFICLLPLGILLFPSKKNIFLFILATLFIGICLPKIIATEKSYPENHIILHQMAGACVPADDSKCFNPGWYEPDKNWKDVKSVYLRHQTDADFIAGWWHSDKVFDGSTFKQDLKKYWLQSIYHHPLNYFKHVFRYFNGFLKSKPGRPDNTYITQRYTRDRDKYDQLLNYFDEDELYISYSPFQKKVYDSITPCFPLLKTRFCFYSLYGLLIFSLVIFFKYKKDKINLFLFLSSGTGIVYLTALSLFSPVISYRYTLPVSIMFFTSLYTFIALSLNQNFFYTFSKWIFRITASLTILIFWGYILCPKNLDMIYLAHNDKPLWQFWISYELGHSISDKDDTGRGPLSWAAAHSSSPMVIEFLIKKSDIDDLNLPDLRWKASPLQFAMDHNPHENVIIKLLELGANPNITNGKGQSILVQAVSKPFSDNLIYQLLQHGADMEITDMRNRANALHWACDHNNSLDVIRWLVESGSDVNNLDNMNRTPLMKVAARNQNPDIMQYLIDHGAILDIQDKNGMTALIRGCKDNSNPDVLMPLLNAGVNTLLTDNYGKNALDYAEKNVNFKDSAFLKKLHTQMEK